jgi:hypothetical protein
MENDGAIEWVSVPGAQKHYHFMFAKTSSLMAIKQARQGRGRWQARQGKEKSQQGKDKEANSLPCLLGEHPDHAKHGLIAFRFCCQGTNIRPS